MRFERRMRIVQQVSASGSKLWGKASLKMAAGIHTIRYRNSAQVDLCARGTRCPFERFAVFADSPQ